MKKFTTFGLISILFLFVVSGCNLFGGQNDSRKTVQPLSNKEFQVASLDQEVYQNATTLLNEKLCESITDKDLKENCKTTVQDKKLLSKILDKSNDSSECESIKTNEIKAICEAQMEQKIESSKQTEKIQKEASDMNILLGKIVQSKNVSDCKNMNDKDWEAICENQIYRDLATEKNDKSLCKKITDKEVMDKCLNFIK